MTPHSNSSQSSLSLWGDAFKEALYSFTALLYPPQCAVCGEFCPDLLCEICAGNLFSPIPSPTCPKCGRHIETEQCALCASYPPSYKAARAAGEFDGELRRLIHLLKYRDRPDLARPLGKRLASFAANEARYSLGDLNIGLVTAVPMTKSRQWTRGYNQAEKLALVVSRELELPFSSKLLARSRSARPQVGLSQSERLKNMENAFERGEESCKGLSVLIIDDVSTTGATFKACSATLIESGAAKVYCLSLADGV